MPNADKCYLQIPFKSYLEQLRVDQEGKLNQRDLDRVAAMEFENYKAIERRINDPDCGGDGCCSYGFSGGTTFGTITANDAEVVGIFPANNDVGPPDYDGTLPAGLYMVTGYVDVSDISGTGDGSVSGAVYGTFGNARGHGYFYNSNPIVFPFSGVVYAESAWTVQLNIFNGSSQSIDGSARFSAVRVCTPCDITVFQFA